jgi:hypothetical protein
MVLMVLGISTILPTIIALAGIWAGAWTKVHRLRLENALKQQMVDRGMPAADIVAIIKSQRPGEGAVELPCASEAIVNVDGEWGTALVLRHEGDRYLVHVVGTEMSDNRWVTGDCVRFAATSDDRCGSPMDWSFPAGAFRNAAWCGKAGNSKPAPVDHEI